jgi:DNA-binding transcriptional regulator YiaG
VDLFVRITADEKELSALHQARPPGVMEDLVSAELHARGLDRFTRDTPSLLTSESPGQESLGHRGMTAKQFRTARQRLGLTQAEIAALFDYDERTVRRWETDGCSGAPSHAILLYLMAKGAVPMSRFLAAKAVCLT